MMFGQTAEHKAQTASITEYATSLMRSGVQVVPGEAGTFWFRHESGAMIRFPKLPLPPPPSQEVRQILWRGRAAVASYLLEPDENHPANAWLYLCSDQAYSWGKLASKARRDIRRGLRELTITPLTSEQLLAHGFPAFRDTRRRNGLNDGTIEEFRRWFTGLAKLPEIVYLGAWKGEQLAAFADITEVDDWAELGCFSMDALLRSNPNDALVYSVLTRYLVEGKYRLVSSGLSSVQDESNAAGLHTFKLKLGFEAHPVHRAFVPHPILRPLINPLTLWGVSTMLRLKPGDRRLKKAQGVLASMRREMSLLEIAESSSSYG
jgi:hypothetical protein